MSRGKWNFAVLILFLFITSCKEDIPVTPGTTLTYTSKDLAAQLANYQYSDGFYYMRFFPDGTFLEYENDFRTSQVESERLFTRTGKYTLEGNLIKLSDVNVSCNLNLHGFSIMWYDQEVALDVSGSLVFKTVTVLNADNYKNELWNYWKTERWAFHYVENPDIIYSGKQEYFYEFVKSNPKVRWGVNYLNETQLNSYEFEALFFYTNPYLKIPIEGNNYIVEFKNNKMYWYVDNSLEKAGTGSAKSHYAAPEISFK